LKPFIHVTVASICEKDKQFLVVEEHSTRLNKNVINQPAGHVELNESLVDAVIRETLEETGWKVTPKYIVGIYQTSIEDPSDTHYLRVCFACTPLKQVTTELDPDIIRTHWLNSDDVISHPHPRSGLVALCIQDYLDGKRFPLDIIQSLS